MMRGLQKRLRRLECSMPRRQPELTEKQKKLKYEQWLVWFAIAQYLGDPTPSEARIAAHARGLGYAHQGELIRAFENNDPEFDEKWALAKHRLFVKFGADLDAPNQSEKKREALQRMEAGLSEDNKEGLMEYFHDRSFD
jgi:hypothetical protein